MTPLFRAFLAFVAMLGVMVFLALVSGPVLAQQHGPIPGTTPDTACGAPGIGAVRIGGTIELQTGPFERQRVDAGGLWVSCEMPKAEQPAPCPALPEFREWSQGPHHCTTANPFASAADNPARNRTLLSGERGWWRQWLGNMRGSLVEQCSSGVRTVVESTCAPATHCDQAWWADVNGKRYRINAGGSAGVPIGAYADATADDGSTVRAQCVAGEFRLAPQCKAPQDVRQVFSRSTRVYRYEGPPLEPGQRVLLPQVAGDPMPNGKPRTMWAACRPDGSVR